MLRRWFEWFVCVCSSNDGEIDDDPHAWSREYVPYSDGHFSMAVVRANAVVEDNCQVEVGPGSLFIGVYDGHGGSDASQYINSHLFKNLLWTIPHRDETMTEQILKDVVCETENRFRSFVESSYEQKPELGRVGSCCLAGYLWKGRYLFLANLGDSRAVMGYVQGEHSNRIMAEQLTNDHNARNQVIRQQLIEAHPDDPQIVIENHGTWRVKGIIQVTRAIGDVYLKRLPFTLDPSFPKFEEVPPPFTQSVISSEPETHTRVITESDRFLIFASSGLWELLTNQQAVEIVHKNPKKGAAKGLVEAALKEAATKHKRRYRDIIQQMGGSDNSSRRFYHDDITVLVIFVNDRTRDTIEEFSYKGF